MALKVNYWIKSTVVEITTTAKYFTFLSYAVPCENPSKSIQANDFG
jgi:hypothetical protein